MKGKFLSMWRFSVVEEKEVRMETRQRWEEKGARLKKQKRKA